MTPQPSETPIKVLTNAVTGVTFRILRSAAETRGELLEMEAAYPPGSAPPPPHFHPSQEERFVVLDASMRVSMGGTTRELSRGERLVIPPGVSHTMWNPWTTRARVNWQIRPALRTQTFFETVFALAAEGKVNAQGTPGLLDLAILVPYFRAEIRLTRPPAPVQGLVFGALRPIARLLGRLPELR